MMNIKTPNYRITYGNAKFSNVVEVNEYSIDRIINGVDVLVLKFNIDSKQHIIPLCNVNEIREL